MPATSNPELNETYFRLLPLIEQTSALIGNLASSGGYVTAGMRNPSRTEQSKKNEEGREDESVNIEHEALPIPDIMLPGAIVEVKDIRYEHVPQVPHPFHDYVLTRELTLDVGISLEPASAGLALKDIEGSIRLTNRGLATSGLLSSSSYPKDSLETPDYDSYYTYGAYQEARRADTYKSPEKLVEDYAAVMTTRLTLAALAGEILNGAARQAGLNEQILYDGDPHKLLELWAKDVHPMVMAEFLGQRVSLKKLPLHPLITTIVARPMAYSNR